MIPDLQRHWREWGWWNHCKFEDAIRLLRSVEEIEGYTYELHQHIQKVEQALARQNQ